MTHAYKVETLTRSACQLHLAQLISLSEISCKWTAEQFMYELPGKWSLSLLVTKPDPVGLLVASQRGENHFHIHELVVASQCQGVGIASSLIAHFLAAAQHHTVSLKVRLGNKPAVALYRKFGFMPAEVSGIYQWMRFRSPRAADSP